MAFLKSSIMWILIVMLISISGVLESKYIGDDYLPTTTPADEGTTPGAEGTGTPAAEGTTPGAEGTGTPAAEGTGGTTPAGGEETTTPPAMLAKEVTKTVTKKGKTIEIKIKDHDSEEEAEGEGTTVSGDEESTTPPAILANEDKTTATKDEKTTTPAAEETSAKEDEISTTSAAAAEGEGTTVSGDEETTTPPAMLAKEVTKTVTKNGKTIKISVKDHDPAAEETTDKEDEKSTTLAPVLNRDVNPTEGEETTTPAADESDPKTPEEYSEEWLEKLKCLLKNGVFTKCPKRRSPGSPSKCIPECKCRSPFYRNSVNECVKPEEEIIEDSDKTMHPEERYPKRPCKAQKRCKKIKDSGRTIYLEERYPKEPCKQQKRCKKIKGRQYLKKYEKNIKNGNGYRYSICVRKCLRLQGSYRQKCCVQKCARSRNYIKRKYLPHGSILPGKKISRKCSPKFPNKCKRI